MKKEPRGQNHAKSVKPRWWPGMVASMLIVIGLPLGIFLNLSMPTTAFIGMLLALVGGLTVIVWWLFFSRVRWSERLGALAVLVAAWFAMRPFLDKSILGGAMGGLPFFTFSVFGAALFFWAWRTWNLSNGIRVVSLVAAMLIAGGLCTLVKTEGLRGGFFQFHWRWTPTPEELLLAQVDEDPLPISPAPPSDVSRQPTAAKVADSVTPSPVVPAAGRAPDWPGFRGPDRDGIVHTLPIESDWAKSPPMELWRQPIGPGWSSIAVEGDLLYTQEQRGDDEIIAAYQLSTGKPVWRHRDPARFYESNGGPGPRGTPTVFNGQVFAFGGTGILNALNAGTGAVLWSRNVSADTGVAVPTWGFSSSPLVINDLVVVAAEGTLMAYEIATGKPRWTGPAGGFSYSSPQRLSIDGVPQIVMLNGKEAIGLSPSDGGVLWRSEASGGAIVQPAAGPDGSVLLATTGPTGGQGIRRLAIAQKSGGWTIEERWTSAGLKPFFNDFVVHNGYAFGFDGSILSSIDLADGKRKWKGGRYGAGQLVLLAEQSLLLVLSDEGEVALVSATPDDFKEIARFKAIEGKTWNHPVVVRDILLVRNGEEMAAFRLTKAQR